MNASSQGRVAIHGHFYQPPRENPWIEEIELEESAAPFHDWNERIVSECYRPNTCSRIVDGQGRILDIVNNYGLMSFDFGPTIMRWLERCYPDVHQGILEGDAAAAERLGYGGAIACAYNHAILPLCNERDLETQIVWGLADFEHRFKRRARALWLPETAINQRVVAALIRHRLDFCILAPSQAEAVRPLEGGEWRDVSAGDIDTTQPYRCHAAPGQGGESISVFFYDAAASHAVSFGDVLLDARRLVGQLAARRRPEWGGCQLLHVAVDGETFGHHKPLADMAVAYALKVAAPQAGLAVVNYSAHLAACPPRFEVRLKGGPGGEGTAWSCAHGLARWQRDCGCTTGSRPGWNQAWRAPLRSALDLLRDRLAAFYEEQAAGLLTDPWAARNGYIEVILDRGQPAIERFFAAHGWPHLDQAGRLQALKLLEMQRHCLLMYTSCGWFYADLAGLEAVQVLRYAARAIELAAELGLDVEDEFLRVLAEARSNRAEMGDGRQVWEKLVRPAIISPERVVNHFAIGSVFAGQVEELEDVFHYRLRVLDYEKRQRASITLAVGLVELTSGVIPEPHRYLFAMTFLGGCFFRTGVQETAAEDAQGMRSLLFPLFDERPGDVINLIEEIFPRSYSLRDVFKERKKLILNALVGKEFKDYYASFEHVFETTRDSMEEMAREGLSVPEEFQVAAAKTLSRRLAEQVKRISGRTLSAVKVVESELRSVFSQARLFGLKLDTAYPSERLSQVLEATVRDITLQPTVQRAQEAAYLLEMAAAMGLDLDLRAPQNLLHRFLTERFAALAADSPPLAEALLELARAMNFDVERYRRLLVGGGQ